MKRPALHMLPGAVALVLFLAPLAVAQETDETAAFTAARAVVAPAARVAALESYLEQHPQGSRAPIAQRLLLSTLLESFPERTPQIHAVATAELAGAASPIERWTEMARLALQLADAGDRGADLPDAALWAGEAVRQLTEPAYRRALTRASARYGLPSLSAAQVRLQYAGDRALVLSAQAAIDLRSGQIEQMAPLLAEALALAPLSPEANRLEAERVAARTGLSAQTLQMFLRADALGPLPAQDRQAEIALFRSLEHGDEAALEQRVDAVYRQIFPLPFILPRRAPIRGGHPALLELFTGSDCLPCTGPDLAVDSLLHTYGVSDLLVLSYDEHIPFPDPLASPDTVERANGYRVRSTPTAFLDGVPLQVLGSARSDVENIVLGFADQIESQAALPSGLQLTLAPVDENPHQVETAVRLHLVPLPEGAASPSPPGRALLSTGDTSLRALQRAELHIALVQDDMRYSGRNGVRLHRAVVRELRTLPAAGALTTSIPVSFDLTQLEQQHAAYLDQFETANDAFGIVHFRQTRFPINLADLSLAAWVQDPWTHQVLQSTSAAAFPGSVEPSRGLEAQPPATPFAPGHDARLAPRNRP